MSTLRLVGFSGALVVAALVGGTIIGSVAARTLRTRHGRRSGGRASRPQRPRHRPPRPEYCATFARVRKAARRDRGRAGAGREGGRDRGTIDKAVADGDLTKAAGDRLKARVEASTADGCKLLAGEAARRSRRRAGGALGVVRDGLDAAAKALDMPSADVGAALKSGKSLKDLATTQKVDYATVSAAIVAAVKADLDKAVAAGTIKQARADRVLDRLDEGPRGRAPCAPSAAPAG